MTTASGTTKLLQRSLQGILKENKKYCSTQLAMATKEYEEIKFMVPWGHVAGKWYGPKNTRPIVGFHGWQDNAGTFDTIAPLLPPHLGFLAIDLPGHGLSSWLPGGATYHAVDYVTFIHVLMREFNWDKISMICHSMSSINGFVFCSLFPDKCDMFIGLDVLKPLVRDKEIVIKTVAERLEALVERNASKTDPPCYDLDQLRERLYEGSGKSINKDCCQFILERNIQPSAQDPNKFFFSRDSRLRSLLFYALPQDVIVEMARRITCPHLFIKALKSPYYENKANYDEVLSLLRQKSTFEYHEVDGTHHVHLNEPKKIADILNPFINKYRQE